MSRKNAELLLVDGILKVRNISDKNPITINGNLLKPNTDAQLNNEDLLTVGSSKCKVLFQ